MSSAALLSLALLTISEERPRVEGSSVFLGTFPIENRRARPLGQGGLHITIELEPRFAGVRGLIGERLGLRFDEAGRLSFDGRKYPTTRAPALKTETRPSFVIDFAESSVKAVVDHAAKTLGPKPDRAALVRFVGAYIEKKNLSRSLDVASVVARRKEGDCTEHAVLLAALLRAFRIPARVVMGLAIVELEGRVSAMGHAWVEARGVSSWEVVDAALMPPLAPVYVPLQALEDEGPGFGAALTMRAAGPLSVRRVILAD